MKECPNCRKIYGDELFFCLDDGSQLRVMQDRVDPNAPTEGAFDVASSLRTEVLPPTPVPQTVVIDAPELSHPRHSNVPFIVIGVLAITCLGLAAILVVMNLGRFAEQSNEPATNVARNTQHATPVSTLSPTPALKTPIPVENKTVTVTSSPLNPIGLWAGSWSTESGTLFDFELRLVGYGDNRLGGFINWTMRRTARPDKESKIGMSAKEWVEGKFDPADGAIRLTGQRKDDPNSVLVMLDEYKLKMSANGKTLTGLARNGGKWNGKVSLSRRTGTFAW